MCTCIQGVTHFFIKLYLMVTAHNKNYTFLGEKTKKKHFLNHIKHTKWHVSFKLDFFS